MKHGIKIFSVVFGILLVGMGAVADWDIGDVHKMHYPQMPKVDGGWDVQSQYYDVLADDWQCSESGYVNDIHTWVSFKGDVEFNFNTIHLAIWSDDPTGEFSKPAEMLWHYDLTDSSQWTMREWDQGSQGWYNPMNGDVLPAPDHQKVFQLNFLFDDAVAFEQTEGTIYWLEFGIQSPHEYESPGLMGWKESEDHFNDAAVWRDVGTENWQKLVDPVAGTDMDLAFVITPEPTTISMIGMASGFVLFIRRRFFVG